MCIIAASPAVFLPCAQTLPTPAQFYSRALQDDPNARGLHAYFGSAILALFLVHGALGLQLGLSL